jgi:hypothetical protein
MLSKDGIGVVTEITSLIVTAQLTNGTEIHLPNLPWTEISHGDKLQISSAGKHRRLKVWRGDHLFRDFCFP